MKPMIAFALAAAAATGLAASARAQPSWDLAHREYWVQDRIEHGRKDGGLDAGEAQRAEDALHKIQHDEAFDARTNNGKLSEKDRATIEARLDDLSDHLHWLKSDSTKRPW